MPISRALIVDDSRTAQQRLKKFLSIYELEIDMATSAEEALGYLSYRMPRVIFMDHHMEGMDGLDALKIIKANPSTATIPVIMYTSRSDGSKVYSSQAHALGALDTLSKSLMKPARVEAVLGKLNIFPAHPQALKRKPQSANEAPNPAEKSAGGARSASTPAGEFKAQIARLFELHIADVRTQISENTKFVVRRLTGEIRNLGNQKKRIEDVPLSVISEEAHAETSKLKLTSLTLLSLILLALVAISLQIYQSHLRTLALENNYRQLADLNYQSNVLLDDIASGNNSPDGAPDLPIGVDDADLLSILAWAMNVDMHFAFGEDALGEEQILILENLIFRLNEIGFKGVVELNVQLGDFCIVTSASGQWEQAADDFPVTECTLISEQRPDLSIDNFTSVAFLQFEQTARALKSGAIQLALGSAQLDGASYAFPSREPTVTAGEWNAIAAKNQQITLMLTRN